MVIMKRKGKPYESKTISEVLTKKELANLKQDAENLVWNIDNDADAEDVAIDVYDIASWKKRMDKVF